ncbi:MAG: EF-hand domain-containing protein [Betaproteobacteria bacterium]
MHKEKDKRSIKTSIAVASMLVFAQANAYAFGGSITVASAESAADSDRKIGEFLDLNDDRKISYDEFVHSMAEKAMRELFQNHDKDRDGYLDGPEVNSINEVPLIRVHF